MARPKTRAPAGSREAQLAGEIRAMLKTAREAERHAQFSAAVSARDKASKLRAELVRLKTQRLADEEEDELDTLKRMRRAAEADGSHVAASRLLQKELELIAKREAEARELEREGLQNASADEVLEDIIEVVYALPDVSVQRILRACEARLRGEHLRVIS